MRERNTLHIVGSSSAVPRPNGACSSYLVRSKTLAIALDLGSGALGKLLVTQSPANLDAIVISHMHADHFFDLVPLRYALKYAITRSRRLPVFLPPRGTKTLRSVVAPFAKTGSFFEEVVDVREYDPAKTLRIGHARIRFAKTRHYIAAYAMRIEVDGDTVAFSADTAPAESVVQLARGSGVFLCESGLGAEGIERGRRGHSNASEAGDMAQNAGARHLVLTHYPTGCKAAQLLRAARRTFSGPVTVAEDGLEIPLT